MIGSLLATLALSGTVDGLLQASGERTSEKERQELTVAIEDAQQELSPEQLDAAIEELPAEVKEALPAVAARSAEDGMRAAIGGMFPVVLLSLILASAILLIRPAPTKAEA